MRFRGEELIFEVMNRDASTSETRNNNKDGGINHFKNFTSH